VDVFLGGRGSGLTVAVAMAMAMARTGLGRVWGTGVAGHGAG
jgi:hypothetical protein